VPKNQHHPTPEERDERVKVDLPPEDFIAGVIEAGPHPENENNKGEESP
jgi:hypothetical protein